MPISSPQSNGMWSPASARSASKTLSASTPPPWQRVAAEALSDPAELCRLLRLPPTLADAARQAAGDFPLWVPRSYLSRIVPGNPRDPLLVQVLPQAEELASVPHFQADPLGEAETARGPGLLWKYQGRILIVTTAGCAVHCRFCFRRHFPTARLQPVADALGTVPVFVRRKRDCPLPAPGWSPAPGWEPALRLAAAEPSIEEIILSGGDPLMLPDTQLSYFAARLTEIAHVRRLRVHSRLPVMLPQRVNQDLLGWLRGSRLTTILVIHVNHRAEIDEAVAAALGRLVDAGVPVLAQSVLLRGVNDDVQTLAELYGRLIDLRVLPYYLHQLDRVAGAAHFEVSEARGIELIEQLRTRLPGYAVPRYVRETPGQPGKTVLA